MSNGFSNVGSGGGMKFRIDWRRGPRELRIALDKARLEALKTIEREAKSNAPESVRSSISRTPAQVRIDHPAAMYIEFGQQAGSMPPLAPLRKWMESVGKDPREAFAIARHIEREGREARPFFNPAIDKAMGAVDDEFTIIWKGGRR